MPIRFSRGKRQLDNKLACIFSPDLAPFFIPCSETDDSDLTTPGISPNRFFSQRIRAEEFYFDYHVFFVNRRMTIPPNHPKGFITLFFMLDGIIPATLNGAGDVVLAAGETTVNKEDHKALLLPQERPYQCIHITLPKSVIKYFKSMYPTYRLKMKEVEKARGGIINEPSYMTTPFANEVIREILDCKYIGRVASIYHGARARELCNSFMLQFEQETTLGRIPIVPKNYDPRKMMEQIRHLNSLHYTDEAIMKALAQTLDVDKREVNYIYESYCYVSATDYLKRTRMQAAFRYLLDMPRFDARDEEVLKRVSGYEWNTHFRNHFNNYFGYRPETIHKIKSKWQYKC